MRARDWSDSPLGPPSAWPQSLRTVVELLLQSRFPMFVAWGRELGFLYNDSYAEILGAKHPKALGSRFHDIWSEIWPDISPLIDAAMAGQATYREDLPLVMNRKGFDEQTWFTFSYSPVRDEHGTVGGMFCAVAETTGRVLAERALRASEANLVELNETLERRVADALAERKLMAELVETTDTFIQAVDLQYRLLAINKANIGEYDRIYGFRPRVGDSILEILGDRPALREAVRAIWSRALAGETFTEIAEFGDPAIERRWYELKFGPLWGPAGTQIGAYQFSNDVTERLRDHARLAEAEEQLRQSQKMEAIGQLTGGIAHDFNNLLATISGSFEVVEKKLGQGSLEGVGRFITAGRRATRQAATLIQRLLAFSRRQQLDPRPTDVNKLIAGMEELIRRSVGPEVEVEVVGAVGLWTVKVDNSQLETALLNLCINGRDAMAPQGGRLTIETANKWLDERAARARELVPGQYISVCVTDTGSGMSPEVMARAFDPFFTTKPFGAGTGLGLSMVYGFARQSGGEIRIYSELGKGTTMCLYLPRHVGDPDSVPADVPAPVDRGSGEVVLVIDDEPSIRMLILEVLEENGYVGLEAGDGRTGLEILENEPRVDLMITDLGLPGGMNGRQVAEAARIRRSALKILFISGFAEQAVLGDGPLPAGTAFITKPFVMSALGNKIRELLDLRE